MAREPLAALRDFYERADLGDPPTRVPYDLDELLTGLDRLAESAPPTLTRFAGGRLPPNWAAFVGEKDPLLDAALVAASLPPHADQP